MLQVGRGDRTSPRHTQTTVARVGRGPPGETLTATVLHCLVQQQRLPWGRGDQVPMVAWPSKGTDSSNTTGHQQSTNPSLGGVMQTSWYPKAGLAATEAHLHFTFRTPRKQANSGMGPWTFFPRAPCWERQLPLQPLAHEWPCMLFLAPARNHLP